MQKQDKLWNKEKEDLNIMEKLYNKILKDAKDKGFKGIANIYDGGDEKLIEIFRNKEEQELAALGKKDVNTFGYCKPLISHLEKILND